jgi:hypothetical protein
MSLFGHLASSFASQPENVATEALAYILSSSSSARSAFIEHGRSVLKTDFSSDLHFASQKTGGDGGVPDLWGGGDQERFLVEVKFWAGLTSPQKRGYGKVLAGQETGGCLFLVPEQRIEHIHRQLKDKLTRDANGSDGSIHRTPEGHPVSVTSWARVLNTLEATTRESTEETRRQTLNDIQQLRGLCNRLNAEGFHPLHAGELGPEVGRRMIDLRQLVEELHAEIQTDAFEPWTDVSQMRRRTKVYRFTGDLYGTKWYLGIMYRQWRDLEDSPLWLKLREPDASRRQNLRSALRTEVTILKDLKPSKSNDTLIPLDLPLGVSRKEVVSDLKDELHIIASRLRPVLAHAS